MGAWGPGVFSNDIAADLRGDWRNGLLNGEDDVVLSHRLEAEADAADESEACAAWTGLALAQFETGRLQASVRDRALGLIEAGGDALLDGDEAPDRARLKALARLAEKLRGPQPAPKRLRGPRAPIEAGVKVGDVVRLWSADRTRSRLSVVVRSFLVENTTAVELLALYCPGELPTDAAGWANVPFLVGLDFSAFDYLLRPPPDYHLELAHPNATAVFIRRPMDAVGAQLGEVVAHGVHRNPPYELVFSYAAWSSLVGELTDERYEMLEAATRRTMRDFPDAYARQQASLTALPGSAGG